MGKLKNQMTSEEVLVPTWSSPLGSTSEANVPSTRIHHDVKESIGSYPTLDQLIVAFPMLHVTILHIGLCLMMSR